MNHNRPIEFFATFFAGGGAKASTGEPIGPGDGRCGIMPMGDTAVIGIVGDVGSLKEPEIGNDRGT